MDPEVRAELHKIYSKIPKINCQGLCSENCSVIGGARAEFQQMEKVSGERPRCTNDLVCNFLDNGKCKIYNDRPSICRLFGVTPELICRHGCVPERMLTLEESYQISLEIHYLLDGPGKMEVVWNGVKDQIIADMAINSGTDFITMRDMVEKMDMKIGVSSDNWYTLYE